MADRMDHDVIPGTYYFNLITIFTNRRYYECALIWTGQFNHDLFIYHIFLII